MSDQIPPSAWACVYDAGLGLCTISATEAPGHHWDGLVLDDSVSDPGERFEVFTGDRSGDDLMVRMVIGDDGPEMVHASFDLARIGSMTIWPGLVNRFMWWSVGSIWTGDRPTAWVGIPPFNRVEELMRPRRSRPAPQER